MELETTMTQKNTGRNSCHGGAETNRTRNHEVAGLIPGLAQGFKDLAFFRELWHKVSDVAQIWHCCGCGIGSRCSSDWTPSLGTSICSC